MATWLEVQRQPPNIGVIVIILTIIIIIIIVKSIINTIAKILTESGASVWRKKSNGLIVLLLFNTGGGQPQEEDHITHQFDRKRVTANLDKYERVALYQSCCLALYQYKIIASLT